MTIAEDSRQERWLQFIQEDLYDDPVPFLNELREHEPVFQLPSGTWLLTRYDDCEATFRSDSGSRFSKDPAAARKPSLWLQSDGFFRNHFVYNIDHYDGGDHTRLRKLMHRTFTPRAVEALRDSVRGVAEAILDDIVATGATSMDVTSDYAVQIPTAVTLKLLDLPEDQLAQMQEMVQCITKPLQPGVDLSDWVKTADDIFEERHHYLMEVVEHRRRAPGDDLISHMVVAQLQDPGVISDIELTMNITFLLAAGFDTTVNAIGSAVHLLLSHPEQLARAVRDRSRMSAAIEEVLRFAPPLPFTAPRWVVDDLTLRGKQLAAGDEVWPCVLAANRDPEVYDRPNEFDIDRDLTRDHRHLTFAMYSPHYCLGASLARMELEESLLALFARFPSLRVESPPRHRRVIVLRGPESFRVSW